MLWIFAGVLFALVLAGAAWRGGERRRERAWGAARRAQRDRAGLEEFSAELVRARAEGLSGDELRGRMLHAAVAVSGATCGAWWVRTESGAFQTAAVAGLFALPGIPAGSPRSAPATKVARIERLLGPQEIAPGDHWLARSARTGLAELWVGASTDEALGVAEGFLPTVGSAIAAPVRITPGVIEMLVVANFPEDEVLGSADLKLLEAMVEKVKLVPFPAGVARSLGH